MKGRRSFAELEKICQDPLFPGFTGANCGHCNATVNVLFGDHWNCPRCNSFNGAPRERLPLHEKPFCGNTAAVIQIIDNGSHLQRRWAKISPLKREQILTEVFAGITLQVTALRDKTVIDIENVLDSEEFQLFQQLILTA